MSAVPGSIGGRALHFCCTERFVPGSDRAEPAGSESLEVVPYSLILRNMLQPQLMCQQPKQPNSNLWGDNKTLSKEAALTYDSMR